MPIYSTGILTKIAGVTFGDRQHICKNLYIGAKLDLIRDPENEYDPNAIGVYYKNQQCGFIPKDKTANLAIQIDSGKEFEAKVLNIKGGGNYKIGVDIIIKEKPKQSVLIPNRNLDVSENYLCWMDDNLKANINDADSPFNLTDEQKEIVSYDVTCNEIVKIIAFAGTGKTTTLLEYAKAYPDKKFLYIAFNRSVKLNAEKKFPSNVTVKTSHGLAYQKYGKPHHARLITSLKLTNIKSLFHLETINEARLVSHLFHNYLIMKDKKFSVNHFPKYIDDELIKKPLANYIKYAAMLWVKMIDKDNKEVGMLHDCYLKQYQLSKPNLGNIFDCILLDEAQDTNPVVADIVLSQEIPKILVGDPHQQIYSFRGAQDAMEGIKSNRTFYLTNSFRFGEEIAWIANKILKTFKNVNNKIKGVGLNSRQADDKTKAILSRTNATLFDTAARLYQNNKISFLGGIASYRFDDIMDTYLLLKQNISEIKNPFIRGFSNYANLNAYAISVEDWEIYSNCKIVEKWGSSVPRLVNEIKASTVHESEAEYILSTGHKAKGAQFNRIEICSDFNCMMECENNESPDSPLVPNFSASVDEINLIYVAITRAEEFIDFNKSSIWEEFIRYGKIEGYEKILNYFGFKSDPQQYEKSATSILDENVDVGYEKNKINNNNTYQSLEEKFHYICNYVLKNTPNDEGILAGSFYNIANDFQKNDDLDMAIKLYRKSLEFNTDPSVYSNLASCYKNLGYIDTAIALYKKCLEIDPDYHFALLRLSFAYSLKNENEYALFHLSEFIDKSQSDIGQIIYQIEQEIIKGDPPPGYIELLNIIANSDMV